MHERIVEKNGLRIIIWPMRETKAVSIFVLVGVGSRYETRENMGISHFLEHMLFKGTERRPDSLAIASTIDNVGGSFNGFIGKEFTGFYVKVASKYLPLGIDLLTDIICHSKLDEEEIERERRVILEEINSVEDAPDEYISKLYFSLLYGDHPLGWDITETRERVKKINREDFLRFWRRYYTPDNLVISVAGRVNPEKAVSLIKNSLGGIKGKKKSGPLKVKENQAKPASKVCRREIDQTHLCLGVRTFIHTRHKDRYALRLLNTILGENSSSRLFIKLREKLGLAYAIDSGYETFSDTGTLLAQAAVDLRNVKKFIKAVLDEFKRLREELVSREELARAKNYSAGKITLALENSSGIAYSLGKQELLLGRIETPEEIIRKIKKVTRKDIRRVAAHIFQQRNLNLVLLGPLREGSYPDFDKLLKI
ncbi:MAG: pitrilysin family protein [Candidatus Aerophobetes bacterium]|nr:pitrilysin family protein [Candidatus Aerophobetes bacterium]